MVYSMMWPQGILEDYIKMKAFPFSLDGVAKDWLYLQLRTFLEKFPASRTVTSKKEICRIKQHSGETLHEFDDDKPNSKAPDLEYGKQRTTIWDQRSHHMLDVIDNLRLENQLIELTSLVRQLAIGQYQPSIAKRVCGICTSLEHLIDMCPTLQETESDHPQECWINSQNNYQPIPKYQAPSFQQQQQQRVPSQGNSPSLEDLIKQLAISNLEFQHNMNSSNMQF
ncbi:hypothetical protein CR513_50533, partial [Mucuna pruriens]